ncbi:hypothetical protein F4815DRAFT_158131 [Daldinia loculata]|uniref:uncharacterized protein n=1 Tax=Daldinia loculata TaxID=103429 RepID=UPI0020C40802|nr:uncharacterized protein F4817DRAFT_321699 [Daldinia loculata]KAI1641573.1 hypothetical protein F4817DRAFT_321699 [Daldinia loculata]KAI2780060.1 hypothetical protein F4815DRAFT_158131 [Daldinia loculata]
MSTSENFDRDIEMELISDYLRSTGGGQSINDDGQSAYDASSTQQLNLPSFVTPLEIEQFPGMDALYPPTPRKFSMPAMPAPNNPSNLPQDPSASDSLLQDEDEQEVGPKTRKVRRNIRKANGDEACTLEEFWYEEGKEWKVSPKKGERTANGTRKRTTKGMEGLQSGPECYACGNKLQYKNIMNNRPCDVCGCFN